ncbi:MAG TPA: hypothetical protein DDZ51_11670, partial [Planctomycetaceae bacterium]|nr:hypothetical protein [Planctomycetaceae bacterium]
MHSYQFFALLIASTSLGPLLANHGLALADENATTAAAIYAPRSPDSPAPEDGPLKMLQSRVEQLPLHSDSWRMLGKALADRGDSQAAIDSLVHALEIDPTNAAAHFNLGQVLLSQTKNEDATAHFEACVSIAPDSNYANEIFARNLLPPRTPASTAEMPSSDLDPHSHAVQDPFSFATLRNATTDSGSTTTTNIQPAGYEIQSFDGADDLDRRFDQLEADSDPVPKRLRLFCELGVLYNSNVSLTPISREL